MSCKNKIKAKQENFILKQDVHSHYTRHNVLVFISRNRLKTQIVLFLFKVLGHKVSGTNPHRNSSKLANKTPFFNLEQFNETGKNIFEDN